MKKRFLILGVCFLLVLGLGGFPSAQPEEPRPLTVCPEGPPVCQFSTIAAAVEAASPYDLIQLYPGTYRETLTITKSLRLVATEPERVLLQGARTGEPTLTLQVQDRLDITIEGLTLLAPPDPEPTGACRDPWASICSDGIDIRGKGALGLTLVNVQITQRENQSATGIDCNFTGTAQVILRRSRIVANRVGMWWTCHTSGSVEIQHTLVSGNHLAGVSFLGSRGETMEISVEESLFTTNGGGALEFEGEGLKVTIKSSEFLSNETGIFADLIGNSLLEISESLFLRNRVILGGPLSSASGLARGVRFLLQDTRILESKEEGVMVWSAGEVKVRNNLIEGNDHGIRVVQASGQLALYDNQVTGNEGWGVALDESECFPSPLPVDEVGEEPRKVFRIVGENNEIRDNGQGDLCPQDYNWPPNFLRP